MKQIVMFSGGLGSWAAAKRVAERHGTEDLILLFADTSMEDEDLYRFLEDAARNVGGELVRLCEGRTPWEVFFQERYLGNTRVDPCSKILKRELSDRWIRERFKPEECIRYVGIDWTEEHRFERVRERLLPYRVEAPMCESPYLTKRDIRAWLDREGLKPPRLYGMGFPHNNCGGFCVKAGQGHFAHLLRTMPERYRYHEEQEERIRQELGDVSILRDRTGGATKTLTLRQLRERVEAHGEIDFDEWGGCGCFVEQSPPSAGGEGVEVPHGD